MISRPLLRLAAASAAVVAVLPALPAQADGRSGDRPRGEAPAARTLDRACPAERVDGAEYTDIAGSTHGSSIRCLSWYGVTRGGADGTFGADRAVTRAQLATFLVRVLQQAGVALPAGAPDAFSDDEGSPHEANLDALAALDVVNGAGDGTVAPDAPVRRDQMATLLVALLELAEGTELEEQLEDYFSDDDDNVHRGPINALAGLGIAAGKAQGLFDPASEVKREQMATFLMRLIDRLVEHGEVRVPATLRLSQEEVAPGDVVRASVTGDGIVSVSLAGCGFDGDVTDADAATDGVQFDLTVPAAWPAEVPDADEAPEEDAGEDPVPADGDGTEDDPAAVEDEDEDPSDSTREECEFVATVTFDDGGTQELEGELAFGEAEGGADEDETPAEETPAVDETVPSPMPAV